MEPVQFVDLIVTALLLAVCIVGAISTFPRKLK